MLVIMHECLKWVIILNNVITNIFITTFQVPWMTAVSEIIMEKNEIIPVV